MPKTSIRSPASRTTKSTKSTKTAAASTTRRTTRKPVVAAASDTDDHIATPVEEEADETIKPPTSPTKSKGRATKVSKPATTVRSRKAAAAVAAEAVPEPIDEPAAPVVQPEPEIEAKAPPTRRATRATVVKKPAAVASTRPAPATTKRSKKMAGSAPSSEPVTETEQDDVVPVVSRAKSKVEAEKTIRSKPALASTTSRARAIPVSKAKTPATTARPKKDEPVVVISSDTDRDAGADEEPEPEKVTPMQVDQPDPERMRMIDTGAKEARSVIESLDQATPTKAADADSTRDLSLTDEQAEMTVVEYIRAMYVAKHRAIKVDGEAKIRAWEERAKGAREVVQGMRCRDD